MLEFWNNEKNLGMMELKNTIPTFQLSIIPYSQYSVIPSFIPYSLFRLKGLFPTSLFLLLLE